MHPGDLGSHPRLDLNAQVLCCARPELRLSGKPPPHLFIALVDDLGFYNVGWRNSEQNSPEIDELAQSEGVILEAVYTFRYCSPSRSALMSGCFPIHINQGNPRCVGTTGGVDLRMTMLPQKLKEQGYATAIIG